LEAIVEPHEDLESGGLLAVRDFRIYLGATFLASLAVQAQSVAVGWQVYKITASPLSLGYVGLVQFLPTLALTLHAGAAADRHDRRLIMSASALTRASTASAFVVLSIAKVSVIWPFYLTLAVFGTARAFAAPAADSLMPRLVPVNRFADAVAWTSSSGQIATIAGPALGGVLYLLGPAAAYSVCGLLFVTSAIGAFLIRARNEIKPTTGADRLQTLTAGVSYVRSHRVVLGAISLDLFAVLFGGAVALLPIYARDILHVGPAGLGLMRSSPAIGATIVGLTLGRLPLRRKAGATMLICVALFGLATIVFGLSSSFILSIAMLIGLGAADMVSVYVRGTMVQLATPDAMRGRVSAVDRLFVGASNELGGFESGVTAQWFGTVPAVVIGGAASIAIVVMWCWLFPEIQRIDDLQSLSPEVGSSGQHA
jgi:MFS family permease